MNDKLVLSHVTVAYQTTKSAHVALHDVNFHINKGEWVTVLGENGSGKSTLGRVCAGLIPVSRGSVHTFREGHPVRVGIVFQNPDSQIVGQTVEEDIRFGLQFLHLSPKECQTRIDTVLRHVGLQGMNHRATEELSGGQKQRLCLASALALQPDILVLDEAFSMQNPAFRDTLYHVVQQAAHQAGTGILSITHHTDDTAYATRVVALHQGSIVYDGEVEPFFRRTFEEELSVCERLGFQVPLSVQVAMALERQGASLHPFPVTVEQLAQAISFLRDSRR